MEDQDKAISEIKEYLESFIRAGEMFGSGWQGVARHATLMLEYGKGYYFRGDSFAGPRAERGMCYMNAYRLSVYEGLNYVEGYVHIGIPIEHAWCVDDNGLVIDPTIEGIRDVLPVQGYFGIPFKREYVLSAALKTGYYGIISYTNPDFLEGKIPVVEFLEV